MELDRRRALAAGTLIGLCINGIIPFLFLVTALPFLIKKCNQHKHRTSRWLIFGYAAGSTWEAVPSAAYFFGPRHITYEAILLWLALATAIALPYALIPWKSQRGVPYGLILGLMVSCISPFAICSPLVLAGIYFPRTGLAGIFLLIFFVAASASEPSQHLAPFLIVASIANLYNHDSPIQPAPQDWQAVQTSTLPNPANDFHNFNVIQQTASKQTPRLALYPEGFFYRWNSATQMFLKTSALNLHNNNRDIIFGAESSHPGYHGFDNELVILGADPQIYKQHFPVPYGMYDPLHPDTSFAIHYGGPYTITVLGRTAAPLICYETLLTYPALRASIDQPDILITASNDYWAKNTYIPAVQHEYTVLWARLYGIPYLSAVNQ